MPHVYFLSYARPRTARAQSLGLIDRFEQDLCDNVGQLVRSDGQRAGFRDSGSIEAGTASWCRELGEQLLAHPVGVVLLSPQYVEQERSWCKWEYQFLRCRNEAVGRLPDTLAPRRPRLLLVLDWIRVEQKDLPGDIAAEVQQVGESIAGRDPLDIAAVRYVTERGLWNTLKLVEADDPDARRAYTRFMLALSHFIVEQWSRWRMLHPQLLQRQIDLPLPPEHDPADTWGAARPTSAAQPAAARIDRAQRRKVFVVYMAARPHEVPDARAWRYRDDGEYDWRPFARLDDESELHIGDIMRTLEGVEVREWQFHTFYDRMEETLGLAGRRYPVLFIIDPWTTTLLEPYREVLQRYVQSHLDDEVFSAPIVLWNRNDPDTEAVRADFEERVRVLFHRTRWEPAQSQEELGEVLVGVVKALQRRIRNSAADRLPTGRGSSLPRISATS